SAQGLAVWLGTQVYDGTACPTASIEPPLGFIETTDTCLVSNNGLLYSSAHRALNAPGLQTGLSGSSPYPNTNTAQVVVLRAADAPACLVSDTYASNWTLQGIVSAPEIVEPSGLGASRVHEGAIYVHNEDTTDLVAISALDAS